MFIVKEKKKIEEEGLVNRSIINSRTDKQEC